MRRLAALIVIGVALALTACTTLPAVGTPDTREPTRSTPFSVAGTFTFGLGNATKQQFPEGSRCDDRNPLQGRRVTVLNQSGAVIASGKLGPGTTTWAANQAECNFEMQIEAVPGRQQFYRLHVDDYKDTGDLTARALEHYHWLAELI
ncbi:hypothetical protein AB4Z18_08550 [Leifsonia sp. 2TAF2]|uniref:hypothetical protein n=1 Tax=Leifsonia sp. 2TAF2 TaxID=3233009 RepID=UPI003F97848A